MASLNPDSFERARRKFEQSVGPLMARKLAIGTLQDVKDVIQDIQQKQGRDDKLRNMTRLRAFLEAMEFIGKTVDAFLNANEIMCFVWGPMKFLLGIARTHLDSFDKLLDAYGQIGEVIPGLVYFQTVFEKHPPIATVLEDYYSDILKFHSEAVAVFNRPKWKKLFHATWKTFDSDFSPMLHSLVRRRELLAGEKLSATLYELEKLRNEINAAQAEDRERAKIAILEKHQARLARVRDKLQPAKFQLDQEMSTEDRNGSSYGQWIFQHPEYVAWRDPNSSENRLLFVNGTPGAGKTTLVSAVVEKLLNEKNAAQNWTAVAYFYFKHGQSNKNTFNSMLRALLDQLIEQDQASSTHFHGRIATEADANLCSTQVLRDLVKIALEDYQAVYMVLDGLDECEDGEAAKSINWLISLANSAAIGQDAKLRILFSGQRDGVLDSLLASQPSISLDTSAHLDDIHAYVQEFSNRIKDKFTLSTQIQQGIVSLVLSETKGMFLYARIVLDNLLRQTRLSRLKQEMQPGVFPNGLNKAYDRVIARVLEDASDAEREDALKVLGLVACAKRLLFWREIQSFFCIEPTKAHVDYDDRLQVTCKALCGSLVDTRCSDGHTPGPEDLVQIVHESARQFLFKRRLINADAENAKMSIFCSQYLLSTPFKATTEQPHLESYARQGYYALQDYTVQYWFDHLQQRIQSITAPDLATFTEMIDLARTFILSYGVESKLDNRFKSHKQATIIEAVKSLPDDCRERNGHFNLSLRTTWIREVIENVHKERHDPATREAFNNLHGIDVMTKCHKPWCDFFSGGIETPEERKRHLNAHELPFYCSVEGCFATQIGFASQSQLSSHQNKHHSQTDDGVKFPNLRKIKIVDLDAAAAKGDLTAVQYLLDLGVDVNERSEKLGDQTPLILALLNENIEVAGLLISRGVDVNHFTSSMTEISTALHAAVASGSLDAVHLLLAQDDLMLSHSNNDGLTAFEMAIRNGRLDIVRIFFAARNMAGSERAPESLRIACRVAKDPEIIQHLLQNGYRKYAHEQCIMEALMNSRSRQSEIIELLLLTGNFELRGTRVLPALYAAIQNGHMLAAQAILRYPHLKLQSTALDQCRLLAEGAGDSGLQEVASLLTETDTSPTTEKDTDPVILTLATAAAEHGDLRDRMKRVVDGKGGADELAYFQTFQILKGGSELETKQRILEAYWLSLLLDGEKRGQGSASKEESE